MIKYGDFLGAFQKLALCLGDEVSLHTEVKHLPLVFIGVLEQFPHGAVGRDVGPVVVLLHQQKRTEENKRRFLLWLTSSRSFKHTDEGFEGASNQEKLLLGSKDLLKEDICSKFEELLIGVLFVDIERVLLVMLFGPDNVTNV